MVTAYLQKKVPGRTICWPPRSPDLSVIENAWSVWKARVAHRRPRDAAQLERVALQEWDAVRKDRRYVAKLFGSMQRRLQAVVDLKGSFAPY